MAFHKIEENKNEDGEQAADDEAKAHQIDNVLVRDNGTTIIGSDFHGFLNGDFFDAHKPSRLGVRIAAGCCTIENL
jgi:hypothetical protein